MNKKGFSLREAAAIAGIPETTIQTAIEKRSIRPSSSRVGKSIRYEFDLNELLFIRRFVVRRDWNSARSG